VAYKIGLPPLWIIFSLIVGGNIFGFTGLILAVPTAATLGVLVRSAIKFYKKSQFYNQ
jgi:predicted PurR-regulated permease PerM